MINGNCGVMLMFVDQIVIEDVEKMWCDFVVNVSYELKMLLMVMMGFFEILCGLVKDDVKVCEWFLLIMESEVECMFSFVDDLLLFSKVEENECICLMEMVNVIGFVDLIICVMEFVVIVVNVELVLKFCIEYFMLQVDEWQLQQVMFNLVENVIKYGVLGGVVELSVFDVEYVL